VIAGFLGAVLITMGVAFFVVGTVGVLRLPDVYTRLHALTKADNLGLGFVVAGLAVWHGVTAVSAKLLLVWVLTLVASGLGAHLVARSAQLRGIRAWREK